MSKRLVMICGESMSGKSASLEFIKDQSGVMYLNCESGKELPFEESQMKEYVITDPYQVYEAFAVAETKPDVHTIVVDGLNYLMDMFESVHVIGSENTMAQWGAYAQYIKNLFQDHVAKCTKTVVFLAHTDKELQPNGEYAYGVPVKGAMRGKVESFFTTIIYAKRVTVDSLREYKSDLLTFNEEEEDIGVKYIFQTRHTRETVNEKIRAPRRLFAKEETFMDNDANKLLDRLNNYYGEK